MKQKRIQFTAQNQIECLEDNYDAHVPDNGALLQSVYTCISAGTENAKLSGLQKIQYPFIPGNRSVCRVLETGKSCAWAKKGDLVLTHSPHVDVFSYDGFMAPLPESLAIPETALLAMGLISLSGVQQVPSHIGDVAIVTGGGLVGNIAAQLLEMSGVTVLLADISKSRRELATECGISHTIDGSPDEVLELAKSLTHGQGARWGLECTGNPKVCAWLPGCLECSGQMVLVGSPRGAMPELTGFLDHFHLFRPHGDLTLSGAHEWKIPPYPSPFHRHSMLRNARILGQLLSSGRLKFPQGAIQTFKPEEATAAYKQTQDGSSRSLAAVFDWCK